MHEYRVVVPSRKRTEHMPRMLKLLPGATYCVEESEVDEYVKAGVPEKQVLPHPELGGIAKIRNWIFDNVSEETVVMIDDDFDGISCRVGKSTRRTHDAEFIRVVIENSICICKDLGLPLFGWSRTARRFGWKEFDPVQFVGFISSSWGQVGRRYRLDERFVGRSDPDLSLQVLLGSRIIYIDGRYYFNHGLVGAGKGGLQGVRTREHDNKDVALLQNKWGQYIRIGGKLTTGGQTLALSVKRRM